MIFNDDTLAMTYEPLPASPLPVKSITIKLTPQQARWLVAALYDAENRGKAPSGAHGLWCRLKRKLAR